MIFKMRGKFQHYDWGGSTFIPNLLKLSTPENKPYAEYWLGAHPSSPSEIQFENAWLPLGKVIEAVPELLGEKIRYQFGDTLPYLLKILDVKHPLSIQVHPTKADAEQGFIRENEAEIALDAPERMYKDRNHKPEMMIALSDFWVLHGFKAIADINASLEAHDSLKPIALTLEEKGLSAAYAEVMQADKQQLASWLLPVIEEKFEEYQADKLTPNNPDYWVCYIFDMLNSAPDKLDGGLVCFYFFNIVHLQKGEGLYQGAGLPHAYLRGQNIELMASSDNVIRGGLTRKHMNIPELLQHIDYRPITPQIIPPFCESDDDIHLYPTPEAKDFALQHVEFKPFDEENFTADSASILLVMKGSMYIDLGREIIYLTQGEAAFIAAESQVDMIAESNGYAVIATLP